MLEKIKLLFDDAVLLWNHNKDEADKLFESLSSIIESRSQSLFEFMLDYIHEKDITIKEAWLFEFQQYLVKNIWCSRFSGTSEHQCNTEHNKRLSNNTQQKLFDEMKSLAIDIWKSKDNTYWYADEKISIVNSIENIEPDDIWIIYRMFDFVNQGILYNKASSRLQIEINNL